MQVAEPSGSVSTFSHRSMSFEQFDASIASIDGNTTPIAPNQAPWLETSLLLDDMGLQWHQEGGANVYEGAVPADLVCIFVGLPGLHAIKHADATLGTGRMSLGRPGETVITSSLGIARHGSLFMPIDRFVAVVERIDPAQTERLLSGPGHMNIGVPEWQTIVAMIERVFLRTGAGDSVLSSQAQQSLIENLVGGLIGAAVDASYRDEPSARGRPALSRQNVLARVSEFLHTPSNLSHSISALAHYAGVSERTLRDVVTSSYGVSPKNCSS